MYKQWRVVNATIESWVVVCPGPFSLKLRQLLGLLEGLSHS